MLKKGDKKEFNLSAKKVKNFDTTQKMSRACSKTWMMLKIELDAKKVEDVMWKAIELLKQDLYKLQKEETHEPNQF